MENTPVINMSFSSRYPGVDEKLWQRMLQWGNEVYTPIHIKFPEITGSDHYQIIRESPEYPFIGTITHYLDLKSWQHALTNPERVAVMKELREWADRHVTDRYWTTIYELVKSIRSDQVSAENIDTRIENAPIVHLDAHLLSPDEQEKYITWLNDFGFGAFMPLFLKLPGLKGYDFFQNTGIKNGDPKVTEYPIYLSVLYFEDIESFENYTKSPELIAYQRTLRSVFPKGLNYKWYVQYQLVRSYRK